MSLPILILGVALFATVVVAVVLFALSFTSVFPISSVEAVGTAHLSVQDIRNLAAIPEGTSILGLDVDAVRARVAQNPWVADVTVSRGLDGTVTITVRERVPFAIVVMESREVTWYLSDDGVWLEPVNIKPAGDRTLFQAALMEAHTRGILLVGDVPASVNPSAGAHCTDEPILGALEYQKGFDEELASQVAYYEAPAESSIGCVLDSGIEVSLGAPDDIAAKNTVILELLGEHPNQLTYINVRVPSRPTYRLLDGTPTTEGSGLYDSGFGTGTDAATDISGGDARSGSAGDGGEGYDGEGSTSGESGGYGDSEGYYGEPSSGY